MKARFFLYRCLTRRNFCFHEIKYFSSKVLLKVCPCKIENVPGFPVKQCILKEKKKRLNTRDNEES